MLGISIPNHTICHLAVWDAKANASLGDLHQKYTTFIPGVIIKL